jgi:hypothetical protein
MDAIQRFVLENELEKLDRVIKAAENWSKEYAKDPESHEKLIKTEAKLERSIRKFFKEQSKKAPSFVDWNAYTTAIRAYDVNTIVLDGPLSDMNDDFIKIVFDPLAVATAVGTQAFQNIYKLPTGLDPTSAIVQQLARTQVAALVGKRVGKDGSITDNPNAAYSISEVTRNDIRESLHTSISIGETIDEATTRLSKTIDDPKRAATIAQTETVNAYQGGLRTSAKETGAVGKLWQDLGADDVCADNSALGPIAIDDSFSDTKGNDIDAPAAHPNCRCGVRYIYQAEADSKGYDL